MIDILPGVSSTVSALNAERIRMDVISQNIANMEITRGPNGAPYRRQQVVFENVLNGLSFGAGPGAQAQSVQIARIEKDLRPPKMVYNPGHPDANPQGMVAMPDINVQEEMVDYIAASRAFEANLAVMKNARSLALQTLAIGKRG